jgi:hypothetical protein
LHCRSRSWGLRTLVHNQFGPLVVLAMAQELLVAPELVNVFGRVFRGRPDVTLLVCAPDSLPDSLEAALGPLVSAAGLDGDEGPAVVGVAVPRTEEANERS